ncbi:MAG TPA: midcut-by-XrtH protein, partial [Ottowia sp.]|nr:midcut-by-XrtH protein [Ottowia sp.]
GLAGGQMMQRAQATLASAQLSQAGGGSVSVEEGETEVVNTSGVPQQIRALRVVDPQNPSRWQWWEPAGTPQCVVGQVLAPAGKCYVSLAQNLG